MDFKRLLLSLCVAVMMFAMVESEGLQVACHNDTIVTAFNISSNYNITFKECFNYVTNYTCGNIQNYTPVTYLGKYIYTCNMNITQSTTCFLNVTLSHSCFVNVTLANNGTFQCMNPSVTLQLLPLDHVVPCIRNSTSPDNSTFCENVTSCENVTFCRNVASCQNGTFCENFTYCENVTSCENSTSCQNGTSAAEPTTPKPIFSSSITKPTESSSTSDDDDQVKIILGVILPFSFIAASVLVLICLQRKCNLITMIRHFGKKHRKKHPKPQELKQVELPDLSQYSSLNPAHHILGQDNYSYATLTGVKGCVQTGIANENSASSHPGVSKEFSTKSYEYIPGIFGQGDGHLGKVDGRGGLSDGSIRSDYTYELVNKATAGREQPNSTINSVYSSAAGREQPYSTINSVYSNASAEAVFKNEENINCSDL